MLMVTLRSAKHQQLMFPLKNSVSKVKRCNISFTNLLFIKQLKFTFLYNITWLLNHTQLPTDLAFWNLLFLHGAECKSRLNLVRGNYLCHQLLKCHKWWRHNFSLQYQYNIKQTSDENNITWLLNHTQLPTDLAFWNLLFLHGAECKSRLNLVRGNYLCHQLLKCHKWWRHNFSLQYQYNIKQTSDENKEKYQLEYYQLIQQQIL